MTFPGEKVVHFGLQNELNMEPEWYKNEDEIDLDIFVCMTFVVFG